MWPADSVSALVKCTSTCTIRSAALNAVPEVCRIHRNPRRPLLCGCSNCRRGCWQSLKRCQTRCQTCVHTARRPYAGEKLRRFGYKEDVVLESWTSPVKKFWGVPGDCGRGFWSCRIPGWEALCREQRGSSAGGIHERSQELCGRVFLAETGEFSAIHMF